MIAFAAIAVLFTLSWVGAIWLYKRAGELHQEYENTWGLGFCGAFIGVFVFQLLLLRTVSGVMNSPGQPTTPPIAASLSLGQVLFIAILTLLTLLVFARELSVTIQHLLKKTPRAARFIVMFASLALGMLVMQKVLNNAIWVGNILVFLILLIALDFAVRLKKSAFILIFAAIMALDVYLVWHTGNVQTQKGTGDGWYLRMFQSKLAQHLPFPIGFRWDGHLLGGGDVFFTAMMVMYAMRVWSRKAAIWVGTLATLPLLLLPFAYLVLKVPPIAWPYTIFISPLALFIAIFAPKRYMLKKPEDWENLDGPEVIGRWPKPR